MTHKEFQENCTVCHDGYFTTWTCGCGRSIYEKDEDTIKRVIEALEMIVNLHPLNADDVLRRCMKRLSGESK